MKETMRQLGIVTALALVFACSTSLNRPDIVAIEQERADAIARNDAAAYSRLVSPDLLVVDSDGQLLTINDRTAAIDSGRARNTRRAEDNVEIRIYGDIALVVGRSVSQDEGKQLYDYFTRIWVQRGGRLEMVGAHYTDITRQVEDDDPTGPTVPKGAVTPLPVANTALDPRAEEEVRRVVRDQHESYWAKNTERYMSYAATDLLRIAENGIRTRDELIQGMRGNGRLPAPPSEQLDVRVRVYGNTAVSTWLDRGTDLIGRPTQNRFTVVFARRGDGWQLVHIQSTGVKHP
jgi:ketosteroid isomerase-like protein